LSINFSFCQEYYQFKKNEIIQEDSKNDEKDRIPFKNTIYEKNSKAKTIDSQVFYEKIGEMDNVVFLKNNKTKEVLSMNKFELKEKANEVTSRWNFGILTLPMKMRFGGGSTEKNTRRYFDLSSDFNLGLAISYKMNKKSYNKDMQMFWIVTLGTSQVKLTPESTNNFIESDQSSTAFSPSSGVVFQFNKDIQLTTLIGWDIVPGKIGREWLYRDKPFFGVGIGFKVFEIGKAPVK
jgi:hypothetical protein